MKPIRDIFYVKANKNDESKLNSGSLNLFIDPRYQPEERAVNNGTIYEEPSNYSLYNYIGHKVETRKDVSLEKGTKVYFHHFTVTDQSRELNIEDAEVYMCNYSNIYCAVKDGKIQMLEHWLLVTPVMEDETNVKKKVGDVTLWLKPGPEKISLHGIIEEINPYYEKFGIKKGDKIIFTRSSEYEMVIEGKMYYRMAIQDVIGVINDGKLTPQEGNIIIRQHIPKSKAVKGLILPESVVEKNEKIACTEVVASSYPEVSSGDHIYYEKGRVQKFEMDGELYAMIRGHEIVGINTPA